MRVNRPTTDRRGPRGEEGAVAVMVVMTMVLLLASAMFAVDSGMLWTTKRDLIAGTDSAALAAVQHLNEAGDAACLAAAAENALPVKTSSASQRALELLQGNEGGEVVLEDFTVTGCGSPVVVATVRARLEAPQFLAGMFGFGPTQVLSVSTAEVGPARGAVGLIPIGFCVHSPEVKHYLGTGSGPIDDVSGSYPGATTTVYRVYMEDTSDCGGSLPGNWGWMGFDEDNPGTSTLQDWIQDGYPQLVDLGAADPVLLPGSTLADIPPDADEECAPSSSDPELCHARPGLINAAIAGMNAAWICSPSTPTIECPTFPIILYDVGEGAGTGAYYHPVAFVGLTLRKMDKQGSNTYMDVEFRSIQIDGPIGPASAATGAYQMRICSVDGDPDPGRCG